MSFLFPNKCPSCLKIKQNRGMCFHCSPFVLKVPKQACRRCGRQKEYCVCDKTRSKPEYDRAAASFYYASVIREAVHNLKFNRSENAGRYLAEHMAVRFDEVYKATDFDMIVAVPEFARKRRYKGFSHADYLCAYLSRMTGIPKIRALKKVVENNRQHNSPLLFRSGNVAGVYEASQRKVQGKRILLVDDVLTTGNTSGECAKMLKIRGAKEVSLIVAATTLPNNIEHPED